MIVTTNLPFGEWTKVFPDARLAKAVVDRLTHRAHIIDTGNESGGSATASNEPRKAADPPPKDAHAPIATFPSRYALGSVTTGASLRYTNQSGKINTNNNQRHGGPESSRHAGPERSHHSHARRRASKVSEGVFCDRTTDRVRLETPNTDVDRPDPGRLATTELPFGAHSDQGRTFRVRENR